MARIEVNGIVLNVETVGSGPPLLLLHGFTGSNATWAPFLEAWCDFTTVCVDFIGHGGSDSPAEASRYAMSACLDDLCAALDALSIEKTAVLGYSMGGRVALQLAVKRPQRVSALILVSASPGIEDSTERAERVKADEALAGRIEAEGIKAFVDYWQSIPLWASQVSLSGEKRLALRRGRLQNSIVGLTNSLCGMGAGAQDYVFDRLGEVRVPALLIAGALDQKYRDLALQMAARMLAAESRIIEGAGHATHLERPDEFAEAVSAFMRRVSTKPEGAFK